MTDIEWVIANPDEMRYYSGTHGEFLADFGSRLFTAPASDVTHAGLLAWMEERAAAGVRVFGIDPITAVEPGSKPWQADRDFVISSRRILSKYGAAMIVVTHPKKGCKGSNDLEDLAGGASWSRLNDNVLWLGYLKEPEDVPVQTGFGLTTSTINRKLIVRKSRNTKGTGQRVGFMFEPRSLTFTEKGILVDE